MLARLGRWCALRHRLVLVLALAAFVVTGAASGAAGAAFQAQFDLPSGDGKRGLDIVDEYFAGRGGGQSGPVVFEAAQGVDDPEVKAAIVAFLDQVEALPSVTDVTSPFEPGGEGQVARAGEVAGTIAYATVEVPRDTRFGDGGDIGEEIRALVPEVDGLRVEVGGQVFGDFEPPSSEMLGLAFAIVILILAFGSVMAMGLPIGTAMGGIGVGVGFVTLLSHVLTMPDFATTLGVMIGLGVGIDYALFIVTRYREGVHRGMAVPDAVSAAIDTAGRAVLFAGTTVVISLLGMLLMGVSFVRGLAIGAAVVVAVTMLASVTLLPALLALARHRVEVTRWRGLVSASLVAIALIGAGLSVQPLLVGLPLAAVVLVAGFVVAPLKREVRTRPPKPLHQTVGHRWSRLVQRRPWPAALAGVVVLGVLAIPVFSLRLGFSDEGNYPEESDTRQAYDLLADGFGPGFNGPLLLAAELPAGTDTAVLDRVTEAVRATDGVAFVSPAVFDDPGAPRAVTWQVIPSTSPQDAGTTSLVRNLRNDVLPAATAGTVVDVNVSGSVAMNIDFSDYLAARLPLFFGAVLALSFLLLMAVFRSVLVPLKAVVMNLLSIGASYGLVVAVFQWGWGADLVGVGKAGPIEPFLPMMLFAIVFGLSMDYEVFLLSRVKEEYDRTGDNTAAVADGLAATARVITAAAAIMVFVFGSFLLESDRTIKLFGLGLAGAIALDASVVRMLLVPATMELLGARNWWLPRWLDRLLPRVDVEGHAVVVPDEREPVPVGSRD